MNALLIKENYSKAVCPSGQLRQYVQKGVSWEWVDDTQPWTSHHISLLLAFITQVE
jgi:hypothetical protein